VSRSLFEGWLSIAPLSSSPDSRYRHRRLSAARGYRREPRRTLGPVPELRLWRVWSKDSRDHWCSFAHSFRIISSCPAGRSFCRRLLLPPGPPRHVPITWSTTSPTSTATSSELGKDHERVVQPYCNQADAHWYTMDKATPLDLRKPAKQAELPDAVRRARTWVSKLVEHVAVRLVYYALWAK
jgi:hypothetical protein